LYLPKTGEFLWRDAPKLIITLLIYLWKGNLEIILVDGEITLLQKMLKLLSPPAEIDCHDAP
jgi:hypothetical protein